MPKMSAQEIRARLIKNGDIQGKVEMPTRTNTYVNKVLSRTNAILARRATFKQASAPVFEDVPF